MKLAKLYKTEHFWLYILAFFAARAELIQYYPFSIAVFVGSYMAGYGSFGLYWAIILGLCSTFSIFSTIKYGAMILLVLIGISLMRAYEHSRKNDGNIYLYSILAGVITLLYGLLYQVFRSSLENWYVPVIEGILVFSFSTLIYKALLGIRSRNEVTGSEGAISTLILLAIVLWGVPLQIAGWITALQGVAYYAILYLGYQYGTAYGTGVGAVCGIILALKLHSPEWLAICILVSLVTSFMGRWSKWLELLGMIGVLVVLGKFYYSPLLSVEALRGLVSACVIYACTPKGILAKKTISTKREDDSGINQCIQQTLQQRIQEYGNVFQKIGENFMMPKPAYVMGEAGSIQSPYMHEQSEADLPGQVNRKAQEAAVKRMDASVPIFARQLSEVGNSLQEFSKGVSTVLTLEPTIRNQLVRRFEREHVRMKDILVIKGLYGRNEVYISAKTVRGRVMTTKEAAEIISKELGTKYRVSTNSRMIINHEYDVIAFEEDTQYHYLTGAARHVKDGQTVSGDNFSQMELPNGQLLMMLADGMGSGIEAAEQSEQLMDLLEEMLEAGFKKETAVGILNELLTVKSQGETFATLDICMIDLYTGLGEFMKMGASATFIKRGAWIETIQSTSLPMGIQEQTEIDTTQKKFYHGDMIVMVSDGLLDGIPFENKEECLKEMLLDIRSRNPQEIADILLQQVKNMNKQGMRDDASILVLGIWKR